MPPKGYRKSNVIPGATAAGNGTTSTPLTQTRKRGKRAARGGGAGSLTRTTSHVRGEQMFTGAQVRALLQNGLTIR
jgi:hypothetical protein